VTALRSPRLKFFLVLTAACTALLVGPLQVHPAGSYAVSHHVDDYEMSQEYSYSARAAWGYNTSYNYVGAEGWESVRSYGTLGKLGLVSGKPERSCVVNFSSNEYVPGYAVDGSEDTVRTRRAFQWNGSTTIQYGITTNSTDVFVKFYWARRISGSAFSTEDIVEGPCVLNVTVLGGGGFLGVSATAGTRSATGWVDCGDSKAWTVMITYTPGEELYVKAHCSSGAVMDDPDASGSFSPPPHEENKTSGQLMCGHAIIVEVEVSDGWLFAEDYNYKPGPTEPSVFPGPRYFNETELMKLHPVTFEGVDPQPPLDLTFEEVETGLPFESCTGRTFLQNTTCAMWTGQVMPDVGNGITRFEFEDATAFTAGLFVNVSPSVRYYMRYGYDDEYVNEFVISILVDENVTASVEVRESASLVHEVEDVRLSSGEPVVLLFGKSEFEDDGRIRFAIATSRGLIPLGRDYGCEDGLSPGSKAVEIEVLDATSDGCRTFVGASDFWPELRFNYIIPMIGNTSIPYSQRPSYPTEASGRLNSPWYRAVTGAFTGNTSGFDGFHEDAATSCEYTTWYHGLRGVYVMQDDSSSGKTYFEEGAVDMEDETIIVRFGFSIIELHQGAYWALTVRDSAARIVARLCYRHPADGPGLFIRDSSDYICVGVPEPDVEYRCYMTIDADNYTVYVNGNWTSCAREITGLEITKVRMTTGTGEDEVLVAALYLDVTTTYMDLMKPPIDMHRWRWEDYKSFVGGINATQHMNVTCYHPPFNLTLYPLDGTTFHLSSTSTFDTSWFEGWVLYYVSVTHLTVSNETSGLIPLVDAFVHSSWNSTPCSVQLLTGPNATYWSRMYFPEGINYSIPLRNLTLHVEFTTPPNVTDASVGWSVYAAGSASFSGVMNWSVIGFYGAGEFGVLDQVMAMTAPYLLFAAFPFIIYELTKRRELAPLGFVLAAVVLGMAGQMTVGESMLFGGLGCVLFFILQQQGGGDE